MLQAIVWLICVTTVGGMDVEQVHVTLRTPDLLTVSWASPSGQVADLIIEQVVTGDKHVRSVVRPESARYQVQCGRHFSSLCQLAGVYTSPLLLHADVSVQPKALYRYTFRLNDKLGAWRQLRAPPGLGQEFRLAVVGDLGQTAYSASTCRDLARAHRDRQLDAAILLGDLAYADTNASRWDTFGRLFDQSGCAEVPWLTIPGNHEIEPDELSGEGFLPYRSRFKSGNRAEEVGHTASMNWRTYDGNIKYDHGGSFFGLQLGCAHLIALNPYTNSSRASPQLLFLKQELARVDRNMTPHLIVATHAPWHHSSIKHQVRNERATQRLRTAAEPLLLQAQADILFAGHVHSYERSHPVSGVRHFVVGHGGNREALYHSWNPWSSSAFRAGDHYGWGILHLKPSSAHWQARRSSDGVVVDEVHWVPQWVGNRSQGAGAATHPVSLDRASVEKDGPAVPVLLTILLVGSCLGVCFWRRFKRLLMGAASGEETSGFKADVTTIGVEDISVDVTGARTEQRA